MKWISSKCGFKAAPLRIVPTEVAAPMAQKASGPRPYRTPTLTQVRSPPSYGVVTSTVSSPVLPGRSEARAVTTTVVPEGTSVWAS